MGFEGEMWLATGVNSFKTSVRVVALLAVFNYKHAYRHNLGNTEHKWVPFKCQGHVNENRSEFPFFASH